MDRRDGWSTYSGTHIFSLEFTPMRDMRPGPRVMNTVGGISKVSYGEKGQKPKKDD